MKQDGFALITGASRGLGKACARALAERHCDLVLVARSPEPLHALASELRQSHPVSVVAIQVDLSTPGAGQILAEQLSSGDTPIDLLVNNAGFGDRKSTRLNSSHDQISYAVFCLKKKKQHISTTNKITETQKKKNKYI